MKHRRLTGALALLLALCFVFVGCNAASGITGFVSNMNTEDALSLRVGESITGYFTVQGEEIVADDLQFISSNEDVANVSYLNMQGNKAYYQLSAVGAGTADVHVQTLDGAVQSEVIKVIVTAPITGGSADGSGTQGGEGTENGNGGTSSTSPSLPTDPEIPALTMPTVDLASIPAFSGAAYTAVNNNVPFFTQEQYTTASYEYYSARDALGRCGTVVACIGRDIMPTSDRGNITSVTPSGWQSTKYDGNNLYNRSHLIAFSLTGENANWENLITGTSFMNQNMTQFENHVAAYVKETGNHVLYRVTPVFEGNNLVASGVLIEAFSVEDRGAAISINVYVYNVQPGIIINYADGTSQIDENYAPESGVTTYVLNTYRMKFHIPTCASVAQMSPENKQTVVCTRDELIEDGYSPCGNCHP